MDNKNANCQLEDLFGDIKTKYNCNIDIENSNIKNIAIDEDFNFGLDNINMEKTPFVSNYINNIQDIPKDFDNFSEDSKIYILKNCIITDKHENSFNISGIMDGEPNYNIGKNIVLTANHVNGQTQGEIKCRIYDNTTNKYSLNCIMDSTADYELDNSITMIDNDFLLIDFEDNPSIVGYNKTLSSKKFYYKKSSGISAGAIVAIIVIPIVTLGLVIGLIYLNRSIKKYQTPESTTEIMNIKKI